MGLTPSIVAPSSFKGHDTCLSSFENKKIKIKKPSYLYFFDNCCRNFRNGWDCKNIQKGRLSFGSHPVKCNHGNPKIKCWYCSSKFILKIDSDIEFYINDIIGYCYNLGGIITYEIDPYIINQIDLKNVFFCKKRRT